MGFNRLAVLLGVTTAAVISVQSVQAATAKYQLESGTTSLSIDSSALQLLKSVGLSFNSAVDTVKPASGFNFGFDILSPSSSSGVLGSDFSFSYDDVTKAFAPLSGTIEHSGSLLFNVDTNKLSLLAPLQIGNFSIGFDGGFFIRDAFSTGLRLFDLAVNANPVLNGNQLQISNVDVLISQEFNDFLANATGSDLNLAGAKVGRAQINATTVPEPTSLVALLTAAGAVAMGRRRHQKVKN